MTNEEPTSDARWASLTVHLWKNGQIHGKTTVSPQGIFVFLVSKRTIFFFGGFVVWMSSIGRARLPGPARSKGVPGRLTVEFVNVGGGLLTVIWP